MNGHEMKVLPDSCRIRKMFDFERLSWQQATDVKKISRRRNGLFSFGYRARARFISPFMQSERYSVKRGKQSHEANVNWLGTSHFDLCTSGPSKYQHLHCRRRVIATTGGKSRSRREDRGRGQGEHLRQVSHTISARRLD